MTEKRWLQPVLEREVEVVEREVVVAFTCLQQTINRYGIPNSALLTS